MATSARTIELLTDGWNEIYHDTINSTKDHAANIVGKIINLDEVEFEIRYATDTIAMQALATASSQIPVDSITSPYKQTKQTTLYALSVVLDIFQREKDVVKVFGKLYEMFQKSLYVAKQASVANILNQATNSSYTGPDGATLASATHNSGYPGAHSNISTSALLSNTSLEQAIVDVKKNHKTVKGNIFEPGGGHVLVTGVELEPLARRLVGSIQVAGTADNDKNVLSQYISVAPGNPYLSAAPWFLLPAGEDNPIRMARGLTLRTKKQDVPGNLDEMFISAADWLLFWKSSMGIQYNAGA